MTASGLTGAFRFVRAALMAVLTIALASVHWAFVVLGVLAFALMAWNEIVWQRRRDEEEVAPRRSAWWAGVLVPMGLGVWASFLYAGIRARRRDLLLWSALYLSAIVLGGYLNVLGDDEDPTLTTICALLWLATWVAGILHARLTHAKVETVLTR